ncbi:UDP-N-acetylmuramoyl-tripeptide--D-alanyl-D-alanine ligase [Roseivirga echinicomitans]|uniref:UDP-N-acetylmuramoyl-tripeptide--D-alanyl-D-alanine ligase n=1 Tax=Roseivirga echinicomitans TaxID=296218 RepID=A0A150X127_9BACT|nr:UDP-N-acetylmuramoyl-tripeptide--D-alanyl-D-alanine ligase [Roseivirga echinicomitans]KYG72444.1 UDP-N-acetylmuramoyl-tripeptide--D-alanyl-D-alanine ligase [Roseivirga echinicomitans]
MNIASLYEKYIASTGICTDTRKIEKGNLFFALKGPNFNANKLAEQALSLGASYAVIDDAEYDNDPRCVLVADVLEALQALANYHRKQLKIPIIAITGSNGKTTTKELTRNVLATKYKVSATIGNLNNHIGVPLTLLSIGPDIEMAIVEMGANHVGEIAALCKIAEPTHGLITNIGKAHLEGFGGFEGVIRGKTEMYHWLIENDGVIFVNSQNEILSNIAQRRIESPIYYPAKGDYLELSLIEAKPNIVFEDAEGKRTTTALSGAYNFENIATALCVGKCFKVDIEKAKQAVATYSPDNNRSQVLKKGSNTIIMDAYNANPTSMKAALENLSLLNATHKLAILGDMLELGETSKEEHSAIGVLTAQLGIEGVIFCGPHMKAAKEVNPKALYFETKADLNDYLSANILEGQTILLKGSRGMGLESLLGFIG